MPTEAGKKVAIAFQAVKQCHSDVGRLLRDLDDPMAREGWRNAFSRDAVTYDVSKSISATYWMPYYVYRVYRSERHPGVVEGVNVRFFSDHPEFPEPLLIAGRTRYAIPDGKRLAEVAWSWDLSDGFLKWSNVGPADLNRAIPVTEAPGRPIEEMVVAATELYSIRSLGDVLKLLELVREEPAARLSGA